MKTVHNAASAWPTPGRRSTKASMTLKPPKQTSGSSTKLYMKDVEFTGAPTRGGGLTGGERPAHAGGGLFSADGLGRWDRGLARGRCAGPSSPPRRVRRRDGTTAAPSR